MTPPNEVVEAEEQQRRLSTPSTLANNGNDVVVEEIETDTELQDSLDAGNSDVTAKIDDLTIDMDVTDHSDAPVLPLSNIGIDTASSKDNGNGHSVEFSVEKDAPENSCRVYDFEMAKEKTLPRRTNVAERGFFQLCSTQPRSHLVAWILMGISVTVCTIVLMLYWLIN